MKRKEKTPKQLLSDENDNLCYWITVANSKGRDTFDDGELRRPIAVHHLIHKTKPAMRHDLNDLFPMKQSNHCKIHLGSEEAFFVAKIIKEKGQVWFDDLHLTAVGPYKVNLETMMSINGRLRNVFRKTVGMGYDEFMALVEGEDDKDYYKWSIIYKIWRKEEER